MKPEETDYRIEVGERALQTFIPGMHLYWQRGLHMCWPKYDRKSFWDFPAHLRADGSWPKYGYRQRPTGGTGFQAIAQVIRYVRDLPRLPIETWNYWASDTIKLCKSETIDILWAGKYFDKTKTCCVLCGTTEWKKGLDWWSLDGVVGPCCWGGRCREAIHLVDKAA